jgi:hypothetical protein
MLQLRSLGSFSNRLDVEWTVKDDHEQAIGTRRRFVAHQRFPGEMRIRARFKDLSVREKCTFEHDNGVRGGVPMALASKTRRIVDEVVLGSCLRILIQQAQSDRSVVHDRLRDTEFEASKPIDEDGARARPVALVWHLGI